MLYSRILPVLPFVISSLVVSSILRTPGVLEFYRSSLRNADSLQKEARVTNVTAELNSSSTRPPLSLLIQDGREGRVRKRVQNVIGDAQFLLDFSIVGFPKCGTSSMSVLLSQHPSILIKRQEMQQLSYDKPADAIWYLYTKLQAGDKYIRGYKSPFDVTNKGGAMDLIRMHFPTTKLIVGVRHPIEWFESFYNFRLQRNVTMPPPYSLLERQMHGFGIKEANFHVFLARLGKTNMTSTRLHELEKRAKFTKKENRLVKAPFKPIPNPIFFYDVHQLADTNTTRSNEFKRNVLDYLGLEQELLPMIHTNEGNKSLSPASRDYIDICEAQYDSLRRELLEISKRASTWIRMYFINAPDVMVSSREYLEEILLTWMHDPCEMRMKKSR